MSVSTLTLKDRFKRKSIRCKFLYEASYTFSFEKFYKLDILNISRDGCLVRMLQVMQIDDSFFISLENKSNEKVIVKCKVVYANGHQVGIKFIKNIDNEHFINNFVKEVLNEKNLKDY